MKRGTMSTESSISRIEKLESAQVMLSDVLTSIDNITEAANLSSKAWNDMSTKVSNERLKEIFAQGSEITVSISEILGLNHITVAVVCSLLLQIAEDIRSELHAMEETS
jgi:hypothetical protein